MYKEFSDLREARSYLSRHADCGGLWKRRSLTAPWIARYVVGVNVPAHLYQFMAAAPKRNFLSDLDDPDLILDMLNGEPH